MLMIVWRRRTRASDLKGHTNGASPLESERSRERLAVLQWLFQVLEHEMKGGWFEHHRAFRGNLQSVGQLAHFHNAVRHAHLVDPGAARNVGSRREESVGCRRVVLDGEIAGGNSALRYVGLCRPNRYE
jgi:hypothetical protein